MKIQTETQKDSPHSWCLGFPGSSAGKESICKAGDPGLIAGSGRSPGEGNGYPHQYSFFFFLYRMTVLFSTIVVIWFLWFFKLINLFYFTILYWSCHTLTWIRHEGTCVPHPEPPSYLPPHPIPLGHPSAPALINTAFKKSKWGNSGSGIQNRAVGPLWIWFQTCSYITETLNLLNCIRPKDTTSYSENRICQLSAAML